MFGVYYRAVSPDAEISCPDFQPEFLSKLKEKLTVKTVLGHVYTVSKALGTEIMEKSMSFSLLLSQTVHLEDAEALQAAMTTAWSSAKSGNKHSLKEQALFNKTRCSCLTLYTDYKNIPTLDIALIYLFSLRMQKKKLKKQ